MTRQVNVGPIAIGGGAPISVQSMTNTDTRDVEATLEQIERLSQAGCDIVRVAVFDMESADVFKTLIDKSAVPLVADVHFDHRLAIKAVENGAHKLRINPGNIGSADKVRAVADCAKAHRIPIRIGVNGGSLERGILERYGKATARGMVDSAISHIQLLEDCSFYDIVVSMKASNVKETIESYRILSAICNYPLHVGVTETGSGGIGIVKSAIGIGSLLADGIGDTIRVSLTGDPVPEVSAGLWILEALEMNRHGLSVISCPMCGRCRINIEPVVNEVKQLVGNIPVPVKAAVMGCVVNGPGEAREADCGVACGETGGALFVGGEVIRKVEKTNMARELSDEIMKIVRAKTA